MQAFPQRSKPPRSRPHGAINARDSVLHLRKLGIQLKSNPVWNTLTTRPPTVPVRSRPLHKVRRQTPAATPLTLDHEVSYVSDIVVPLPFHPDEINLRRSATAQSFYSTSRTKQVPLPHVSEQRLARSPGSTGKPVLLHGERFVPQETKDRKLKIPSSPSFSATNNSPIWSNMTQKERIQAEQEARERSREMKRTSEIMSHRQDRRYYMTGCHLNMKDKYDIDEEELERLRKKYMDRQSSARSRYGEAMGMLEYKLDETNTEGCEQFSPGGDIPPVAGDAADNTFITQTGQQQNKESPHNNDYSRLGSVKRVNTPVTDISSETNNLRQGVPPIGHEETGERVKSAKSVHFAKNDDIAIIQENTVIKNGVDNNENIAHSNHDNSENAGSVSGEKNADNVEDRDDVTLSNDTSVPTLDMDEEDARNPGETPGSAAETSNLDTGKPGEGAETVIEAESNNGSKDGGKEENNNAEGTDDQAAAFKIDREYYKPSKEDALNVDFAPPPEPPKKPALEERRLSFYLESDNIDMDTLNETLKSLEHDLLNVDHLKGTSGWVFPEDLEEVEEEEEGVFQQSMNSSAEPEETNVDARAIFRKRTESLVPKESEDMGLSDMYMYSFISDHQRALYTKKFQSLDGSGNGVLSMKELHQKLFVNASKRDIALFMKVFDLNNDKTIDVSEFVTVAALNDRLTGHVCMSSDEPLELNLPKLAYHITAYREMFELVDQDCSGTISLKEMMVVLTAGMNSDIGTDKDFVEVLLKAVDKDRNGYIDFVEYLTYIPFFLQIHRQLMNKPVLVEDIETARIAVRQALRRKPQYESYYKTTKDIWD